MTIIHVHGDLGPVPLLGGRVFGQEFTDRHQLEAAAKGITTVHESDEKNRFEHARLVVWDDSPEVYYLGFAYHESNLRKLFPGGPDASPGGYGTAYELPRKSQATLDAYKITGQPVDVLDWLKERF